MRQRVGGAFGASMVLVTVLAVPSIAAAAPSPSPTASGAANPNLGPAISGSAVCTMSDPQLTEISGLVATTDGYAVINDSNVDRSREKIFLLDDACRVTRTVSYPSSAFDPEDLAVTKDGTLWVADIGDNTTLTGGSGNRRSSIALWSLAPGANAPVIHRLAYPDGKARDAEALLIDAEGRPVIITKDPVGEVYTVTEPLPANNANPAPLSRAGSFKPLATGTANPYGILGTGVVTGAAMSPDGKRAVVRTMSDAYEFDLADGDLAEAITGGTTPRITPLPSEPQGEAITYSRDGTEFLTTSDQPKPTTILRYTPYAPPAPAAPSPAAQAQAPKTADRSFLDSLTLQDITRIVTGIGVVGLVMIAVGVFAVIRSRRQRRALLLAGGGTAGTAAAGASSQADTGEPADDGTTVSPAASDDTTVSPVPSDDTTDDGGDGGPGPVASTSGGDGELTQSAGDDGAGPGEGESAAGESVVAPAQAKPADDEPGSAPTTPVPAAPASAASPASPAPAAAPPQSRGPRGAGRASKATKATKSTKRPRSGGSDPAGA
ncbi:hypothetical protein ACQP00_26705 [Dactylosporangium sp. CS-047395]|uniref:hypothetical protein n=1 Tax=Dactylosporangium sp. CS-047395 TaxID=3239936 RepID=UPI003D8FBC8B